MPFNPLLRLAPRASVKFQLIAAATMWLIGASILLIRGIAYLEAPRWDIWALIAGLLLGTIKSRLLLERAATKAVARIYERGRGPVLGFFSGKSWLLIGVMMGSGITLRHIFVQPGLLAAEILGAVYIGVGTALLIADQVFWRAVFAPSAPENVS